MLDSGRKYIYISKFLFIIYFYNDIKELFIPQWTIETKGPDRLPGPKALDPNHCRQQSI